MTPGEESALTDRRDAFTTFVEAVEPRVRRALVASYGVEDGVEATATALAYAWEHWDDLRGMRNPAGYLFRVGQTAARRGRRRPLALPPVDVERLPEVEPGLPGALSDLSQRQRVIVLLVHAYEFSYEEVGSLLGLSESTVRNHLRRGMRKLRKRLGVEFGE